MSIRAFLSHASADKPFVEEVKQFLEDGNDIDCWLDSFEIEFGENIVSRISDGLTQSDFLLLFLSPTSLKSRWVEEEWTAAYFSQVNAGSARLIPVLIKDAQLPLILQNKKYCDLRTSQLENMRQLKTRLLRDKPSPAPGAHIGASLPYFIGREAELTELKERLTQPGSLVPIVGMAGVGKTYLAREFIRRYGSLFDAVYQLDCAQKDLPALTGDLATQAGLSLDGEAIQVAIELQRYLSGKRCLLFLDNVDDNQPGALVPDGRAAVMVTSRNPTIPFFADYPELKPPLFNDHEALELFRRILGTVDETAASHLFRKLGHLPIAITVSAGLIKNDVHYTVDSLVAALPTLDTLSYGKNNVGLLLTKAIGALDEMPRNLLIAMASCAPGGTRLGFAAEVAELSESDSLDALQDLYSRSLVVELDRVTRRYRLHTLTREAARPSEEIRQRHAKLVLEHLEPWENDPIRSAEFIEEAEQATSITTDEADQSGVQIANLAGHLASGLGRMAEAHEFYVRVQKVAAKANRNDWLHVGFGNQALILQAWGRLDEAMALHQKKEAICLQLGDRAGLQASYGNQALILKAWGRLDEAMALHQKQEAICLQLGDRAGLQASYGNQALILQDWGRLDEAMALHKKEEAICLQLGDRAGLQASYGNQALILKAWGRLDEAMALHKKEEAICLQLGDRAGLRRSYGNQALILKAWGRLDEAMALHKKEEAICLQLGDRASVAHCYWNWGLLAKVQNDGAVGREKLESALAIFTELKMPRQRDAVLQALNE